MKRYFPDFTEKRVPLTDHDRKTLALKKELYKDESNGCLYFFIFSFVLFGLLPLIWSGKFSSFFIIVFIACIAGVAFSLFAKHDGNQSVDRDLEIGTKLIIKGEVYKEITVDAEGDEIVILKIGNYVLDDNYFFQNGVEYEIHIAPICNEILKTIPYA